MKAPPPLPLPAIPAGQDFAKDSFWYKYRHRFMWWNATRVMDWYLSERDRAARMGAAFPPAPFFTKKSTVPAPWNGREEKAGRVPRTGKE